MEKAAKAWVKEIKKNKWYVIMMGDLCEMAIKTSPSDIYEQTMSPDEQINWVCEVLDPIKDYIIGGLGGNHGARLIRTVGVNPDAWICQKLGVPYLGSIGYGRIGVGQANWKIMAAHGVGGGALLGSKLNVVAEKMTKVCTNADLYLAGHTHADVASSDVRMEISVASRGVQVNKHVRRFSGTGALLDYYGYPEDKLLPPATTMQVVHFLGRRVHVSGGYKTSTKQAAYTLPYRREVRVFG